MKKTLREYGLDDPMASWYMGRIAAWRHFARFAESKKDRLYYREVMRSDALKVRKCYDAYINRFAQ